MALDWKIDRENGVFLGFREHGGRACSANMGLGCQNVFRFNLTGEEMDSFVDAAIEAGYGPKPAEPPGPASGSLADMAIAIFSESLAYDRCGKFMLEMARRIDRLEGAPAPYVGARP